MQYWIKLIDNEKIQINEVDYVGLSHGLFIENLKFVSKNGTNQVIPLRNIKLWFSFDPAAVAGVK